MHMIAESQILSAVMDKTRQLTAYYINVLKETNLHQVFEVNGIRLNTTFWIMAHLAVTENYLLLRSTGGIPFKLPWARQFGMGSVSSLPENCPPLEEVKQMMHEVHQKSMEHIALLDPDMLD